MKSTLEHLTVAEREALVHWYNSDSYRAYKKLCQLEIDALGKDALSSQNHEQTRFLSGQAEMAKKLIQIVRSLYEDSNKKS